MGKRSQMLREMGRQPNQKGKRKSGLPNMHEIDQMSSVEIRESLKKYRTQLMSDNGTRAKGGKLENPARIPQTRRTIARMITVLQRRGERVNE